MKRSLKTQWGKDLCNDILYFCEKIINFFTVNLLLGIIIILLCVIAIIFVSRSHSDQEWAKYIVLPICSSIIAGFCVSIVIDIRKNVANVQSLIVKSFTDYEFLKQLTEDEISELRKKALKQLHERKYPNMQEGLMSKEKEVFDALIKPYYSRYRETGVYKRKMKFKWGEGLEEERVLFRRVNVEYTINSPLSGDNLSSANLSMKKTLDIPKHVEKPKDAKEIFTIKHFLVSIDGKEAIDIKDDIDYKVSEQKSIDHYYNTVIELFYKGHNNAFKSVDSQQNLGVFVDFNKSIDVHLIYDIFLPYNDMHFTSRLRYPAKSFRIDCFCEDDPDVHFFGELLGTFTSSKQRKITHAQENMLSIEALDWLLTKNGVYVIMCAKKDKNDNIY